MPGVGGETVKWNSTADAWFKQIVPLYGRRVFFYDAKPSCEGSSERVARPVHHVIVRVGKVPVQLHVFKLR